MLQADVKCVGRQLQTQSGMAMASQGAPMILFCVIFCSTLELLTLSLKLSSKAIQSLQLMFIIYLCIF